MYFISILPQRLQLKSSLVSTKHPTLGWILVDICCVQTINYVLHMTCVSSGDRHTIHCHQIHHMWQGIQVHTPVYQLNNRYLLEILQQTGLKWSEHWIKMSHGSKGPKGPRSRGPNVPWSQSPMSLDFHDPKVPLSQSHMVPNSHGPKVIFKL